MNVWVLCYNNIPITLNHVHRIYFNRDLPNEDIFIGARTKKKAFATFEMFMNCKFDGRKFRKLSFNRLRLTSPIYVRDEYYDSNNLKQ